MTYNDNYYNYTLLPNQTTQEGEHFVIITCQGDTDGFSTFTYEINPTGIRPTEQRTETITRTIYFIFGIAIIFFLGYIFIAEKTTVKYTFFLLSFIFFLIAMNIVFVSMQDEVVNPRLENLFSFLVAASFYMYWFIGGLIFIMWFLAFFNSILMKRGTNIAKRMGDIP
jgi:hypothetical protein